MAIADEVRKLFQLLPRQEKAFLGGPPFTENIRKDIANYEKYVADRTLPGRQRASMGACLLEGLEGIEGSGKDSAASGALVGYHQFTVLVNANPTSYERQFIHLVGPLNYVQGKCLFVHPGFRRKGFASMLVVKSLQLAKKLETAYVADVLADNSSVQNLLEKHSMINLYGWTTPHNTRMYRYVLPAAKIQDV